MSLAASLRPQAGRRLGALAWSHLLNDGVSNYLPGVLPAILLSLGEPVSAAGALMAALIIGQALQPVTGWLADKFGGRSVTTIGLLFSSLGGCLLVTAPSVGWLVVDLLVIGAGGAAFHPQALAGVRSLVTGRAALFTSMFMVGGEIGRGIWPTIASLVVAGLGLGWLWIVGVPGLLTVPLLFLLAPRMPRRSAEHRGIRLRGRGCPLALLVSFRGLQSFSTYALVTFLPILWHLRGGSLVTGATIITTMITAGIVGNLWGGHLTDRLGRRPVLLASGGITAAAIVPMFFAPGPWVWVLAGIAGMSTFLTSSAAVLIGQDIFPENRSMGSGIALGLGNAIGSVLVLFAGFAVHDVRGVLAVFLVAAALSVGTVLLAVAMPAALMRNPAG